MRLVTYNVHGCVGGDRVLSVDRVASVLQEVAPDVVVLQELDVARARSGLCHQPSLIAERLGMNVRFCATVCNGAEQYGHAIFSRYAMRLVKTAPLPLLRFPGFTEVRSVLWVECALPGTTLQVLGTHLGLSPAERWLQATALLGSTWMGDPAYAGPRVLCGDMNMGPTSVNFHRLGARLRDAQRARPAHRPRATFPAWFPMFRLDHVFASDELGVVHTQVGTSTLAREASDHLPLIVDFEIAEMTRRRPPSR